MNTRVSIMPGVMLTAVQSDKFKTGCFSVNFLRPLCREEASKNALIFSVLLRGTQQHPDIQSLSAAMDELYGAEIGLLVRKKGEVQSAGLYADFVEDDLLDGEPVFSQVVNLLAEMLMHPVLENGVFRQEYVEREKDNLIHSIRSRINSKRSYAVSQMVKTMFCGEAYAVDRLGEQEDVVPITAESLYSHYEMLLATSQIEICYMGRQKPETVENIFRTVFSALPRRELVSVSTTFVKEAGDVKTVEEKLAVTQGKLCMGFRLGCKCDEEGWPAVQMFNAVFGSGVTSKLFVNVREKMSLCYYASSSLEKFKGAMVVSSGIEFADFERARDAILEQLAQCKDGNISDDEMRSARRHLLSGIKTMKDSPGQMDEFYLGQAITGRTDTLDDIMGKLEKVSKQDVMEAACRVTLDTVYFLKGVEA